MPLFIIQFVCLFRSERCLGEIPAVGPLLILIILVFNSVSNPDGTGLPMGQWIRIQTGQNCNENFPMTDSTLPIFQFEF